MPLISRSETLWRDCLVFGNADFIVKRHIKNQTKYLNRHNLCYTALLYGCTAQHWAAVDAYISDEEEEKEEEKDENDANPPPNNVVFDGLAFRYAYAVANF